MNMWSIFLLFFPLTSLFSAIPNYAYLTNFGGDSVSVINASDNSLVTNLSGSPYNFLQPGYLAFSPDETQIWVANIGNNSITVFSAEDNSFIANLSGGSYNFSNIQYIQFSADGSKVYATNHDNDTVTVLNAANFNFISSLGAGFGFNRPNTMILSNSGSLLLVANEWGNSITVISTATDTLVTTLSGPPYNFNWPQQMALTSNHLLFVPNSMGNSLTVLQIDETMPSPTFTHIVTLSGSPYNFDEPISCVLSNNQAALYVCNFNGNSVTVLNPHSSPTFPWIASLTSAELIECRCISFDPFSSKAYVTNFATNSVSVLDSSTNTFTGNFSYGFMLPALTIFNQHPTPPPPSPGGLVPGCEFLFQTSLRRP